MKRWGDTGVALRVTAIAAVLALAAIPLISAAADAVGTKASTVTVTSSSPAETGAPITFTAMVAHNATVPTGTVTFTITGTDSSTPGCDGGSNSLMLVPNPSAPGSIAQCTISAGLLASASPYFVVADYSGDATFAPSEGTLSKVIHKAVTSTAVTSSSTPTVTGQPVTFSATVNPVSPATGLPTGSVMFGITGNDGSTPSCDGGNTVALSGNVAQCTLSGGLLASGSPFTVAATYLGDSNYATSTGTTSQGVARASVTIGVTGPASTPVTGQPVTFTASILTVAAPGAGTPTGSILFSVVGGSPPNQTTVTCDGGDTVPLSGGGAQCNFSGGLPAKPLSYTVTATLVDSNFKSPVAGSFTQQVSKASTTTTTSGLPGSLVFAQAWSFQVTVQTNSPGTGAPTGFLEWAVCPSPPTGNCTGYPGGTLLLPTPTANDIANNQNKATISIPGGMKPGFYTVNATYEGTGNLQASVAAIGHVLVNKVRSSTSISLNRNPVSNGGQLVIKAAVMSDDSRSTGQLGAPSGTVDFTITGMTGDTVACNGGNTVTISTTTSNQGLAKCTIAAGQLMTDDSAYSIQAVYSGDSNYYGSMATGTANVTG
jgi:hypothetical protein